MRILVALYLILGTAATGASWELNHRTLPTWFNYLRPTAEELEWRGLNWRTSLGVAVDEADRTHRPILLWAMNGHPLGCT
ncbi:MAG TPA: hypothetical protein VIY86_06485 [Pirellulaceae bacterium]